MSNLQPYQQRVIQELNELWDRLVKLEMFLGSPEFVRVPAAEQSLLREQATHMINYHRTLLKRVDAWAKPPEPTTPQPVPTEAVWYDEPPFPKDYATRPCWIAGARRVFAGAVYWDTNEWRVYPMGVGQPYSLAGRRVSPITKPPEPTP